MSSDDNVLLSGRLFKWTNFLTRWSPRYVKLSESELSISKRSDFSKARVIPLLQMEIGQSISDHLRIFCTYGENYLDLKATT